jgi:hypothetical protein
VRSDRTTGRFFHQRLGQGAETLQESFALGVGEPRQSLGEWPVAAVDPGCDLLLGEGVQIDERAPPVVRVLAAVDERVVLEVAREFACSGQRQAQLGGDLAYGARTFRRDVGKDCDVPPAERRLPADEREQLVGWPAAMAEPANDPPQQLPHLAE